MAKSEDEDYTVVSILNFLTTVDVNDEEEVGETLLDASELVNPFGPAGNPILFENSDIRVKFTKLTAAMACVHSLNGLVIGGVALTVTIVSTRDMEESNIPIEMEKVIAPTNPSFAQCSLCVCVEDLVLEEDLMDEDEAIEVHNDVASLFASCGGVSAEVWMESMDRDRAKARIETPDGSISNIDASFSSPCLVIEVLSRNSCADIVSWILSSDCKCWRRLSCWSVIDSKATVESIGTAVNRSFIDDVSDSNLEPLANYIRSAWVSHDCTAFITILLPSGDTNPSTKTLMNSAEDGVEKLVSELCFVNHGSAAESLSAYICRVALLTKKQLSEDAHGGEPSLIACASYSEKELALRAMFALNGSIVGGRTLRAWLDCRHTKNLDRSSNSKNHEQLSPPREPLVDEARTQSSPSSEALVDGARTQSSPSRAPVVDGVRTQSSPSMAAIPGEPSSSSTPHSCQERSIRKLPKKLSSHNAADMDITASTQTGTVVVEEGPVELNLSPIKDGPVPKHLICLFSFCPF